MNISFILDKALSLYAEKEAVVCNENRVTYRQFTERVYRLSNALSGLGIRKGDRVAILYQNSHQFLEAYFAAAVTGTILLPLNIRLSPKELAFILKDSGASLLIASRRYKESVAGLGTP
jgi:acyl-CoA synthetase (AMP-forming)/AMP-acid ligase II